MVLNADPSPILRYMTESLAWKSATVAEYSFPSKKQNTNEYSHQNQEKITVQHFVFALSLCV